MSKEITDEEIEKVLLEVLKKKFINNKVAKEKRKKESVSLSMRDVHNDFYFYSKTVLIETKERLCGFSGGTNNLDTRIIISYYDLFRKDYLTCGPIQEEPYPLKSFPTKKGREKLDSLSS